MKNKTFALLAIAYCLGTMANASATTVIPVCITTADGSGADALIRNGAFRNTSYGTAQRISVKNDGVIDFNRKSYLRFDLSPVAHPVTDASLTLTHFNGWQPLTIQVYGVLDGFQENWNETTLTWNNAPANNIKSGSGVTSDAVPIGSFKVPVNDLGEVVTFSSPSLVNFINDSMDPLVTLILTTPRSGASPENFASKENLAELSPPTLSITAVPLPAAGLLFASLLASFAVWQRRKIFIW
jgi:hypothetical protein